MSDALPTMTRSPQDIERKEVLNAIGNKFSKHELSLVKTNDELIRQVASKYGLERNAAQRDVICRKAWWR